MGIERMWLPGGFLVLALVAACSGGGGGGQGSDTLPGVDTSTGVDTAPGTDTTPGPDAEPPGAVELAIACADTAEALYGDPGALPEEKGAILKCVQDGAISTADLTAALASVGYTGQGVRSGAHVYRVLYRTERGNGDPGTSSALVFLPDAPPAGQLPVVVASHGSRGQAGKCAPSLADPAADSVKDDFLRQVYPLVAYGFPVIAPDLAGYANYGAEGNPPSGYAQADDVARSTLDGARAMRNLAPARLSDQVVIVGHSQGGHTALSALAAAETYGAGITVAAVAIFAPLWLSQRSWGAIFLLADSFPIADSPAANVVTLWYHYTHGELLDGPGGGLLPFAEDKRDAIQAFVDGTCWSDSYPALEALGTTVKDLFDPAFMAAVQGTAAVNNPCPAAEPGKTVCETWKARYLGDRPHLTGAAAEVPLLVVYGGKDTTIPPDRFQCALDRLDADGANMTQCFDPEGAHGDTVARQADYVVQWIAFHTLGTPLETSCPSDAIVLLDPEGAPVPCAPVPPND